MVRITEELVRKRAEHNEMEIGSLEELSLHQEDVEVIEHLQNWCKHLQILYLQSNLISRIENLHKLKKLEYLNLAINNIERIENLEGCESLNKLDLTLNFIGDLRSVESLKCNIFLKELFLTGNPCTDYDGYRLFVIATLPQLQSLDSVPITRSEQIIAQQEYDKIKIDIDEQQNEYKKERNRQKERLAHWVQENENVDLDNEEINKQFWESKSEHAPETRVLMAKYTKHQQKKKNNKSNKQEKRVIRLFTNDDKPLNVNEAKIPFRLIDDDPTKYVLDIAVYKFLDTSLIQVDVDPTYVRVTIKGKLFQLVLPEEIIVNTSTTQRSKVTGHLVITLPKFNIPAYILRKKEKNDSISDNTQIKKQYAKEPITKREYLEIGPVKPTVDYANIINNKKKTEFVDDPDVPPLE